MYHTYYELLLEPNIKIMVTVITGIMLPHHSIVKVYISSDIPLVITYLYGKSVYEYEQSREGS